MHAEEVAVVDGDVQSPPPRVKVQRYSFAKPLPPPVRPQESETYVLVLQHHALYRLITAVVESSGQSVGARGYDWNDTAKYRRCAPTLVG